MGITSRDSSCHRGYRGHISGEILIRIMLISIFFILEFVQPRMRHIHTEEWWLYKNPRTDSYVPAFMIWIMLTTMAVIIWLFCVYISKRQHNILSSVFLSYTLTIAVNGCVTNMIKLLVGRPRPDFYYRCFPDGIAQDDCTGKQHDIIEGRKSFPSGHSSFAWSCLTFVSLFLAGQLQLYSFNHGGHTLLSNISVNNSAVDVRDKSSQTTLPPGIAPVKSAWKLCLVVLPLCVAAVISLSRMIDYHHHPEDVAVGSFLGFGIANVGYRLYFPPISHHSSHIPFQHPSLLPTSFRAPGSPRPPQDGSLKGSSFFV